MQQAGQALLASDAAVIVVKPDPVGVALAAPYLRLAEASRTPTLVFVNRVDESKAGLADIVSALQDYSSHSLVLRQVPIYTDGEITGSIDLVSERAWRYRDGQRSALMEVPESAIELEHEARAEMLEELSELDDWLLEELIEEREPPAGPLYSVCAKALRQNAATPVFFGSAEAGHGIMRMMKALRHEAPSVEDLAARLSQAAGGAKLNAVAFHADHRKHLGKVVFLRGLGDATAPGDPLGEGAMGHFVAMNGAGGAEDGALQPSAIAAVAKSDHLRAGRLYAPTGSFDAPAWATSPRPMAARAVLPARQKDEAKLSTALAKLAEDDPGLALETEPGTGRSVLRVQGPGHLREIRDKLAEVFGLEVEERAPRDTYRETCTRQVEVQYRHRKQSGGAGQFADVKLTVGPNDRGAGFAFSESVKGGSVPKNYIPAVEAGAFDAAISGPLGFPVIDLKVSLLDGRHHSVDSSDFAFRTAGKLGVAKALADADPVLLQPIHEVTFHVPSPFTGALVPLVSTLRGQVLGFERDPDAKGWDAFRALLPESALAELAPALRAATQGTGYFEDEFDHFEEVFGKDAERVLDAQSAGAA